MRDRLKDPTERSAWFDSARNARLWLAGVVLMGLFIVPPLAGSVADTVFEPKRSRRLFGGGSVKRDSRAETLETLLELGFWIAGLGVVARRAWRERPQNGAAAVASAAPAHVPAAGYQATMLSTAGSPPQTGAGAVGAAPTAGPGQAERAAAPTVGPAGASSAAPTALPVRYRIESELGRGGMGVVYRATDTVLDRTVALKSLPAELLTNAELVARFQREAKVVAALTHPNIVNVFDLVHQDGQLYMAMELVQGRDLADLVEEQGALPQARALSIALQSARALAHAHERGVIHRDFKPDNVLLTADGTAKVTDFGIAKAQNKPQMTQTGAVMGTPYYMSPEQATGGDVDARTDLYALGATIYELLTGDPPFVGNTAQVLMMHLSEEPASLAERAPEVDPELCELVHSLLQKDREQRPANMAEVVERLEGLRTALSA